jgi:hypothetical protein
MKFTMPSAPISNTENLNTREDIENWENLFYKGGTKYNDVIDHFKDRKTELSELDNEKREWMFEAYSGMKAHHNANLDYIRFNIGLDQGSENNIESISREEYNKKFNDCEYKGNLIDQENQAIEHYNKSLCIPDKHSQVETTEIKTLLLDLHYRQAQRIEDANERNVMLEKLEKEYKFLTQEIPQSGKRAKVEIITALNSWLKKEGLDHAISIFHALPLDDHKNKIDHILIYGENLIEIALKSYEEERYVPEINQQFVQEEKTRAQGRNTFVINISSDRLEEAINLGKTNYIAKQLFKSIGIALPSKKNTQEKNNNQNLTIKQILDKYTPVKTLIELNYLSQEDSNYIPAVLKAKKKIEDDLRNPATSSATKEKILQIKEQS